MLSYGTLRAIDCERFSKKILVKLPFFSVRAIGFEPKNVSREEFAIDCEAFSL